MSYVAQVLQPGEEVLAATRIHWWFLWRRTLLFVIAAAILVGAAAEQQGDAQRALLALAAVALVLGLVLAIGPAITRATTELAVTNRRIIHKTGLNPPPHDRDEPRPGRERRCRARPARPHARFRRHHRPRHRHDFRAVPLHRRSAAIPERHNRRLTGLPFAAKSADFEVHGRVFPAARSGRSRADQYRQDPSRHRAHARPPHRHDRLPAAPAGARELRPGGAAQGRARRRAHHRRGEDRPAEPRLFRLHRRIDAARPAGRVPRRRRDPALRRSPSAAMSSPTACCMRAALSETMFLGADTIRPLLRRLVPEARVRRPPALFHLALCRRRRR